MGDQQDFDRAWKLGGIENSSHNVWPVLEVERWLESVRSV